LFQEQKQDQTDFVLSSTPELADSHDPSMTTKSLLFSGIDSVEFAYSDGGTKGETAWSNAWSKRSELPKLVRIRVAFRSGDTRSWPDLLITPRIAADVSCVYDPITKRCRGR
jgi:general secretion pathway protein J